MPKNTQKEPKEIEIPFLERFRKDVSNGQKVMTTRSKKYGEPEDWFWVEDGDYKIKCVLLAVFRMRLWHVAYQFYDAEGLREPVDFVNVWNEIHPRKSYHQTEQDNFWVHVFSPAHEWEGYEPTVMLKESSVQSNEAEK
jgi:hypothetical protein